MSKAVNMTSFMEVVHNIYEERRRQTEMYGSTDHPDAIHAPGHSLRLVRDILVADYEMLTAVSAKTNCSSAFRRNEGTWLHLLLEEVAEAAEEAVLHNGSDRLETELVEVAAVAVAWLQAIRERRGSKPPEKAEPPVPDYNKDAVYLPGDGGQAGWSEATSLPSSKEIVQPARTITRPFAAVPEKAPDSPSVAGDPLPARGVAGTPTDGPQSPPKPLLRAVLGPPRRPVPPAYPAAQGVRNPNT